MSWAVYNNPIVLHTLLLLLTIHAAKMLYLIHMNPQNKSSKPNHSFYVSKSIHHHSHYRTLESVVAEHYQSLKHIVGFSFKKGRSDQSSYLLCGEEANCSPLD